MFNLKVNLNVQEVLSFLERMEAFEVDDGGWDHFINVPIKDAKLDAIREACWEVWENENHLKTNIDGDYILNSTGIAKIRELKKQCAKYT